jgi:hypothetical protein
VIVMLLSGVAAAQYMFDAKGRRYQCLSYAGDWVTRLIRRRGEPTFQ